MSAVALGALLVGVAALASVATLFLARRRERTPRHDRTRIDPPRVEGYGPGRTLRTTIEQPVARHLRRDVEERLAQAESAADRGALGRYLADIRDLVAAEEAVFWEWLEERDTLRPWAWSTANSDRPRHFRMGDWGPLVQWAAQERLMHTAGPDPSFPQVAVAPVVSGERLYGVLSVASSTGLSIGKAAVREWLPRHADHVAMLSDVFDSRRSYSRLMRQGQALLQAADQVRGQTSREGIASALCDMMSEVTNATDAALVRWDPEKGTGLVQHASGPAQMQAGVAIGAESLVARACVDGLPIVMEEARLRPTEVFGPELRLDAGSLAVVPIIRNDVCLGAIVISAEEAGRISHDDARNVGLLAAVASPSLEIVREAEEAELRARIDPLTGLANRRQFEEQLARIINETDRFGGAGSLVLVDIDHFKRVNDTYGHQAGDQVLRHVARILAEGVRSVDVCARYGGEELAILLPQTFAEGACELAERLRKAIADRPVRHGGETIPVTASFGVASYPETVSVRESLFPAADKALYAAKHDGRNCVRSCAASPNAP